MAWRIVWRIVWKIARKKLGKAARSLDEAIMGAQEDLDAGAG